MKKPFVLAAILLLLLAGAAYGAISGALDLSRFSFSSPAPSKEFAAHVNGEGIRNVLFELRFAQAKTLYETQGTTLAEEDAAELKQQILQDMINELLLVQHGKERGIEATEEAIENEYQRIIAQFPSEGEFLKNLAAQDVSLDDVRRTVAQDYVIQQIIESQASENGVTISEEETQQAYEEAVASGADVPPFEEAQPQIQDFLRQQKIAELMRQLIEELRSKATIEVVS